MTPSVSEKSINKSKSESNSDDDNSSFDINNPHIKEMEMLEDEDFGAQQ